MSAPHISASTVSCFTALGDETVKQAGAMRNSLRNTTETPSRKILITNDFRRNRQRNKSETLSPFFVSPPAMDETASWLGGYIG